MSSSPVMKFGGSRERIPTPPTLTTENLIQNALLLLLLLVVPLPQYFRIWRCKSTEGISPYSILLSNFFSVTAFAESLIASEPLLYAYRFGNETGYLHGWQAFGWFLGFMQIGSVWIGAMIIFALYLYHNISSSSSPGRFNPLALRLAVLLLLHNLCVLYFACDAYPDYPPVQTLFHVGHIIADLFWMPWSFTLALIQHVPQIYQLGKGGQAGSLSIISLGMQSLAFVSLSVSLQYREWTILATRPPEGQPDGTPNLRVSGWFWLPLQFLAMALFAAVISWMGALEWWVSRSLTRRSEQDAAEGGNGGSQGQDQWQQGGAEEVCEQTPLFGASIEERRGK